MHRLRFSICLALLRFMALSGAGNPDFTGVWKLAGGDHPQFLLVQQKETELHVVQFIDDRPSMVSGSIDGQSHSQMVDGKPCDFLARREGASLFYEIKCELEKTQRLLRLGADGRTMSVKRTEVRPRPATFHEKWRKQEPPPGDVFVSGFDNRRKPDPGGAEGNLLRGLVASSFNDLEQAERDLPPVVNHQPDAREALAAVYGRNALPQKALMYSGGTNRAFHKELARHPAVSVTHGGPAHVQLTRDPEGRIMFPVSFAGKDTRLMFDTGTATSLLRKSEAERLGLKLASFHMPVGDGNVSYRGILTIVPVLTIGATRLENVPFLVVPDERCEWPGIMGIDLMLKVETFRWNASAEGEVGFPAAEKDIGNANLCFSDFFVLAEVALNGKGKSILFLDTGNNGTRFFPRFAIHNLDLVTANARQTVEQWHAQGAHGERRELSLPEITLNPGSWDATLRPVLVELERPSVNESLDGTIGMDLLNSAAKVTLDFRAMRLTLE